MTTIVTRAGKGSALTHNEVDTNFTNLNSAKYESGNSASFANLAYTGTLTGGTGVINIGSGQVYKDASGNVGIGTASPTQRLDVNGVVKLAVTSAPTWDTNSYLWSESGVGLNLDGFNVKINTGNTRNERMRIDSSGNVGIGTSSPAYKLDVLNESRVQGTNFPSIYLHSTNAGGKNWRFFTGGDGQTGGTLVLRNESDFIEAMVFTSAGNVGIGTSSPTARLDVNSDIIRVRTAKTPSSAADTGNEGDICWDSSYLYVCVATNTWKRSAISTW